MPDTEFIISVAAQIPIVSLFAWFVINRDKKWQDFFDNIINRQNEQMKEFSVSLDSVAEQLAKNTVTLIMHDATVRGKNPSTMGSTQDILDKLMKRC